MKKILVLVDFSIATEAAIRAAFTISYITKAKIELIHNVVSYDTDINGKDNRMPDVVKMAKWNMKQITNYYKGSGINFTSSVKKGNPYKSFIACLTEPVDLIISGITEIPDYVEYGLAHSSAKTILMHANYTTYRNEQDLNNFNISNIVVRSTFHNNDSVFVENISQLQQIFNLRNHLIYVNSSIRVPHKTDDFTSDYKISDYEFHVLENVNIEGCCTCKFKLDLLTLYHKP